MATLDLTGDLPRFGFDAPINDGTGQRTATRFIIHRLEGNPYQYAHLKLIGRESHAQNPNTTDNATGPLAALPRKDFTTEQPRIPAAQPACKQPCQH